MHDLDIRTDYMGNTLNTPILVGACPMTLEPEKVRQLALAGAGAVVLPSLFEEQIVSWYRNHNVRVSLAEDALPIPNRCAEFDRYNGGLERYLQSISRLKSVTGIPVLANIHGCTGGQWLSIVEDLQRAGTDAIEVSLETQLPTPEESPNQIERRLLDQVASVCSQLTIPVSVKLSRFHTNLGYLARRLAEAGASGIVCFGHEPTWDVRIDQFHSSLGWDLTTPGDINSTISGLAQVAASGAQLSLAAAGGIASNEDSIRAFLAGADVVMLTSEIYRSGPDAVAHLVEGLSCYLSRKGLSSLSELRRIQVDPEAQRTQLLSCISRCP